jgi:5-amino-6-(5-phospho-D-ribitylamino)uracil phosphatase
MPSPPPTDLTRKLFVSDLDGTLLRPDKTLGPRSRDVLTRFIAAGGRFTVATGRSAPSAAERLEGIALPVEAIVHNGALTVDLTSGAVSSVTALSGPLARRLYEGALQAGICPMAYALRGDGVVALHHGPAPNRPTAGYLEALGRLHPFVEDDGAELGRLRGLAMILLDDPERIEGFFARLCDPDPDVTAYPGRSAYTPGLGVGEVTSSAASKGAAARHLAQSIGLRSDALVAFGDNLNDLPLLEAAAQAFCPPEAQPAVLAATGGRIKSAAEEGVASYLEDLLQSCPNS